MTIIKLEGAVSDSSTRHCSRTNKAHDTYGSLPLADLINPTIELLESGVPVATDLYWAMQDTQF